MVQETLELCSGAVSEEAAVQAYFNDHDAKAAAQSCVAIEQDLRQEACLPQRSVNKDD